MVDIICKMEYNINQLTDYLAELTGCEVKRLANGDLNYDQLPLAIESCYTLCDIEFLGTMVTIAIPTGQGRISPMQLAKHQARMMEVLRHPVIFALENVPSYYISRLTRARVNFIIAGKIIFIPSLLMVLREVNNVTRVMTEKMPPVAQMLILYHLEKEPLVGHNTKEIAELVGLAYPTVNVALRWLEAKNIIALVGGKQKCVQISLSNRELWDKALSFMSSPIERTLFADAKPDGSLMAGETAMGYYTMLAEPSTPHMAIDKVTARRNKVQLNKEYGNTIVEIWKYSPSLLSGNGVVDRLSLYLCMKDNSDERIQIESDTLIDDMKW